MNLSIGIVGLPNVGKSTLFNALTNSNILAANYPFATIEPNTGIVSVPDDRLIGLAKIYQEAKIIPAQIEFIDIAGLVAGASKGEGLGNKFLSHIRSCKAIIQVVRDFDSGITRSDSSRDPAYDIDVINTELVLADIGSVSSRLPKLQKEAKPNPKLQPIAESLQKILDFLQSGKPLWTNLELFEIYKEHFSDLQLLTAKPILYLFNLEESKLNDKQTQQKLADLVSPAKAVFTCAKLEDELKNLDPADQDMFLSEYNITESTLVRVIQTAYDILGLQSYLTAGPKEIRAWTIKKGSTAPQAAGEIHTDFEKGFIAASIINFQDLINAGSETAAKSAGKMRTEGKTYIMQDGDVVEFRFNV